MNPVHGRCARCGEPFVDRTRAHNQRFCSDRCRKLEHAGNPMCEVCGTPLSWGSKGRCVEHSVEHERRHEAARERAQQMLALRQAGLTNVEIAAEMATTVASVASTLQRSRLARFGLQYVPPPYWTDSEAWHRSHLEAA